MAENEDVVVLENDTLAEDDVQDWSALNAGVLKIADEALPKREGKFFDQDGSNTQMERLSDARNQMYFALLHIRGHHVKLTLRAVWCPSRMMALVPHAKGSFFKDVGVAHTYKRKKKAQGMWLSPFEVVYLVERGSLVVYLGDDSVETFLENEDLALDYEPLKKLPLSHLYALALALDLDLVDQYETYALLKRLGYLILERKVEVKHEVVPTAKPKASLWERIYLSLTLTATLLFSRLYSALYFGRVHFFSFTLVYQLLRLISTYTPGPQEMSMLPPLDHRYRIMFDVWKPSPGFSKKNPPVPDFQVSVVNVSRVPFPSISVIKAMWGQVKRRPTNVDTSKSSIKPKQSSKFVSKRDERLKRKAERDSKLDPAIRSRNDYLAKKEKLLKGGSTGTQVVLAAVDTGVINFSIFNETEFSLKSDATIAHLNCLESRADHGIVWNEKVVPLNKS